jgi:2-amino-4-hydroxy-6-hydroxymethyldihydropteridine diphosphokinase
MKDSPSVFLGLGSNLGNSEETIERSLPALGLRGFRVTARSSLYLTEPVEAPGQGSFLNAVVGGETELTPEELLAHCLEVEAELGRVRGAHHGPRTLDIDLLLFGSLVRATPDLTLPHPRLHERLFVLVPLEEIAPEAWHPRLGKNVRQLRGECPDRSALALYRPPASLSS